MVTSRDDIIRCFAIIDYLNRIPSYRVHDWSVYFQQFQQLLDLRLGIVWIVGDRPVANIPDEQLTELISKGLWTEKLLRVDQVECSKPSWVSINSEDIRPDEWEGFADDNKTIKFDFKTWLWLPITITIKPHKDKSLVGVFQGFCGEDVARSFDDLLKNTFEVSFQRAIEQTPSILELRETHSLFSLDSAESVGTLIAEMGKAVKSPAKKAHKPSLTQFAGEKLTVGSYLSRYKWHIQDGLKRQLQDSSIGVLINFMRYSVRGRYFFYSGIRDPDRDTMLERLETLHIGRRKIPAVIDLALKAAKRIGVAALDTSIAALKEKHLLLSNPLAAVAAESAQLFSLLTSLLDPNAYGGKPFLHCYYDFLVESPEGVKWFIPLVDQGGKRVERCQAYVRSLFKKQEASNDYALRTIEEFGNPENQLLQDFHNVFNSLVRDDLNDAKEELFNLRDSLLMLLERIPIEAGSSVPGLVRQTGSSVPFANQYLYIDKLPQDNTFKSGCLDVTDFFESLLLTRVPEAAESAGVTYPIARHGTIAGLAVLVVLKDNNGNERNNEVLDTLQKARSIVEASLILTPSELWLAEQSEFAYQLSEMVEQSKKRLRPREPRAMDIFFENFDRIQDHIYARLWEYEDKDGPPRCVAEQGFVHDRELPSKMTVQPCSDPPGSCPPEILEGLKAAVHDDKTRVVRRDFGEDLSDLKQRIPPENKESPQTSRHAIFFGASPEILVIDAQKEVRRQPPSQPAFAIEWVSSVPGEASSFELLLHQERLKLIDEYLRGRKNAVNAARLPLVMAIPHELRTAAIVMQEVAKDLQGYLEKKKSAGCLDPEVSEIGSRGQRSATGVLENLMRWGIYADEVMDYFISEQTTRTPAVEPIALKELIEIVIPLARTASRAKLQRAKGIDVAAGVDLVGIDNRIPDDLCIKASESALKTLFMNLLINALKHTGEVAASDNSATVAISYDSDSSRVRISNPDGAANNLQEVCDFVNDRGEPRLRSLGLMIAKHITRDQGWDMSASLIMEEHSLCIEVDFHLREGGQHVNQ